MISSKLKLPKSQKRSLKIALKNAEKNGDYPKTKRLLSMLLLNAGQSVSEIAELLQVSGQAIRDWIKVYLLKGFLGAPIGKQPIVQTSGTRKGYKVFGLIDYFTGRFFSKGYEGKLNSESYIDFLTSVLSSTRKHIILIQDGAPYHKGKKMDSFFKTHQDRLSVFILPSYSPDYNPTALKSMRAMTRKLNWRNRSNLSLEEIARRYNPVLDGCQLVSFLNYPSIKVLLAPFQGCNKKNGRQIIMSDLNLNKIACRLPSWGLRPESLVWKHGRCTQGRN